MIIFLVPTTGQSANKFWDGLFKKKNFSTDMYILYYYIEKMCKLFPKLSSGLIFQLPRNVFYDPKIISPILEQERDPFFKLTPQQIKMGDQLLLQQGITKEDKLFCFHNRDSAYLKMANPTQDWSHHDYRDSSIKNYIKAAEVFRTKGFKPIRLGKIVETPLTSEEKKRFIDYTDAHWQSDFMDIYLSYRSKIFLCSDTGISVFPEFFHKPVVYVNWTLLPRLTNWVHYAVFIPKKIYSKKLNRLLTFKELLEHPQFISPQPNFDWSQFNLIENSEDEILAACLEMESRLDGSWQENPEDIALQVAFWNLYPKNFLRPKKVFIGRDFLREHKELLTV